MASNICKPSRRDNSLIIKPTKYTSKPTLLLKDYLRDDLSSCSSSGFKSFPRRQCCTTVGFQHKKNNGTSLPRRRVRALQRASEAVITAIKSLSSQKSAKTKKTSTGVLSRSFSRKLLSRRFWRKAVKEEGSEGVLRCKRSFRELLMQERDYKPTSFSEDAIFSAKRFTTVSSDCCSNSWGESEFTFSSNATSSDGSNENDLVDGVKDGASHHHKIEGVTTGDWSNEKEQFSPVSILDCPFEDEEEMKSNYMINSFFEGAEHKHMQKTPHFENISSMEPLVLENRIKCLELEDEPQNHSTKQCSEFAPVIGNNNEEDAHDLFNFVKRSVPSNDLMINAENLLFDYIEQSIEENNVNVNCSKKLNFCKVVEDWIQGQPQELYLGWEVKEGRHVYISEMEKCGEWKNTDQETEQLVLDLENEVLTSLVNEIILDLVK
ncbi:hypothetical protein MtrunA17_Chr4g0057221 [Medicago truncatula]|uniref:DUF4378 domain protein n=1 Tax=Medicago truncatula TaxID=3880 RepID=A0A072URK1_MEDTR|nr:uncharacterized protein LOC25493647 [Medicago truncatula]KEH31698.1 hypothetical protein MTR_4g102650 [Medicago truncatula]RHN63339.1 hypothetical protein MtrunA17_Chr4g0057221 [Medicago truncatula]